MTDHLAEFLPWDSRHFGWRIARAKINRLNESTWRELDGWRRDNEIDCLYFMADAADQASIRQALRFGFDLVETRLMFERDFDKAPPVMLAADEFSLRIAKPADADQLAAIAKGRFGVTRFRADRCFDQEKVERMYQSWIRRSVTGDFDDAVIVAEAAPELLGFTTCRLNYLPGIGSIGLTCVAESSEGKGISLALKRFALGWFHQQGMRRACSQTQASNIGIQISNCRAGLVPRAAWQFFHKWFRHCPNADLSDTAENRQR